MATGFVIDSNMRQPCLKIFFFADFMTVLTYFEGHLMCHQSYGNICLTNLVKCKLVDVLSSFIYYVENSENLPTHIIGPYRHCPWVNDYG